jgi:hypothetical protein
MSTNDSDKRADTQLTPGSAASTSAPPDAANQDDDRDFNPFAIEELPDDTDETDRIVEELMRYQSL